jgi:hypothetical protein
MLVIQKLMPQLMPPVDDAIAFHPACPNCGRLMSVSRLTPGTDGLPDLWTYKCGECGVCVTEAAGDIGDQRERSVS